MVLGDCLTEASREKPDLLLNYATLTGASRVAVGTELAAMYCNNDDLSEDFKKHGGKELNLVPCINYRDDWVNTASKWINQWALNKN